MQLFSLISSLPALQLTETPKLSEAKFLDFCEAFLPAGKMQLLRKFTLRPGAGSDTVQEPADILKSFPAGTLMNDYMRWEFALRNSLARLRTAKHSDKESVPGVRIDGGYEADADRSAIQAYGAANPLDRERILDQARWEKLAELAHRKITPFTFDAVCAYYMQLQIAGKWTLRREGDPAKNLDLAAEAVQQKQHEE